MRSTRAPTKDRLIDKIMGGNPVFRGTRVPVHMLAELVPSRVRARTRYRGGSVTTHSRLATATSHPDSWWPTWESWISQYAGGEVRARHPGDGRLKPIEDAPGSYVKVRAAD